MSVGDGRCEVSDVVEDDPSSFGRFVLREQKKSAEQEGSESPEKAD